MDVAEMYCEINITYMLHILDDTIAKRIVVY